jgi:hypothetical protein
MPRPKVVERRRCVKACESCKKRKEKCDGLTPCANCKKRNREDTCEYPVRVSSRTFRIHETVPFEVHDDVIGRVNEVPATDSPPDISRDINGNGELVESNMSASATSAPVPQLSRLLRDPKGKFGKYEPTLSLTSFIDHGFKYTSGTRRPYRFFRLSGALLMSRSGLPALRLTSSDIVLLNRVQ